MNTLCNRLLLAAFLSEQHRIGEKDVQAIARELRDEIDPDAGIAPLPTALGAESRSYDADQQRGVPQAHRSPRGADRPARPHGGAAIELLHRLFHPERSQKPGSPGGADGAHPRLRSPIAS
jgi:hypothetical protein